MVVVAATIDSDTAVEDTLGDAVDHDASGEAVAVAVVEAVVTDEDFRRSSD